MINSVSSPENNSLNEATTIHNDITFLIFFSVWWFPLKDQFCCKMKFEWPQKKLYKFNYALYRPYILFLCVQNKI